MQLLEKFWEVVGTYQLLVSTRDRQKLIEMIWKMCICHNEKNRKTALTLQKLIAQKNF